MVSGGHYGLVHPNAEKVWTAHCLWLRFGDDPDFQATLDDLYGRITHLLDCGVLFLHPGSSIEDAVAKWDEIVAQAENEENVEVLLAPTQLVKGAVDSFGLWCPRG